MDQEEYFLQARLEKYTERMEELTGKGFTVADAADYLGLTYLARALSGLMSPDERQRLQEYKAREQEMNKKSRS